MSSKEGWDEALEEVLDTTVRCVEGDADSIERLMSSMVASSEGFILIGAPEADEGTFLLLDTESTNPEVQATISRMNLHKYAAEFLREKEELNAFLEKTYGKKEQA